ncbi:hypothetical protein AB4114_20915 [Paenibacillus sp. 2RAB27]|uniref:hypothetical protein n=1 Tax=Paenibacillus sp. 2RAB27 TaxID=3232991 RepID=UPI003F99BF65
MREVDFEVWVLPDPYVGRLMRPFTNVGNLYVQPFTFSPIILCYNKAHFREANLPEPDSSWNWDDVQRTALNFSQKHERLGLFFL